MEPHCSLTTGVLGPCKNYPSHITTPHGLISLFGVHISLRSPMGDSSFMHKGPKSFLLCLNLSLQDFTSSFIPPPFILSSSPQILSPTPTPTHVCGGEIRLTPLLHLTTLSHLYEDFFSTFHKQSTFQGHQLPSHTVHKLKTHRGPYTDLLLPTPRQLLSRTLFSTYCLERTHFIFPCNDFYNYTITKWIILVLNVLFLNFKMITHGTLQRNVQ